MLFGWDRGVLAFFGVSFHDGVLFLLVLLGSLKSVLRNQRFGVRSVAFLHTCIHGEFHWLYRSVVHQNLVLVLGVNRSGGFFVVVHYTALQVRLGQRGTMLIFLLLFRALFFGHGRVQLVRVSESLCQMGWLFCRRLVLLLQESQLVLGLEILSF